MMSSARVKKTYPDYKKTLQNIKNKKTLTRAEISRLASTGVCESERSKEILEIVNKNRRSISELYFFITMLLDSAIQMLNSKKDINLSYMFLIFCKRLLNIDQILKWNFKTIHLEGGVMTNKGDENYLAQCILELYLWKGELMAAMDNKEDCNPVIKGILKEPEKHLDNDKDRTRRPNSRVEEFPNMAKQKFNQYYNQKDGLAHAGSAIDEGNASLFKMYTIHQSEQKRGEEIIKSNPVSISQHRTREVTSQYQNPKKVIQKALIEGENFTEKQIDIALQLTNQNPYSALERLRREGKLLLSKINTSFGQKTNIQQVMITGNRDPVKIFEILSVESFNESECLGRRAGSTIDVIKVFDNEQWTNQRKMMVIQCELFDNDDKATERARFLNILFRKHKSDDKDKETHRPFWNLFDSFSSTDLTFTIKQLTRFNIKEFVDHPSLKAECNVCYLEFLKPEIIQYNCDEKCFTCCECVMKNFENNMGKTHKNLHCMMHGDLGRNDDLEIQVYAKLQQYCLTHGDAWKELFQRFDRYLNSNALEKMDDFTRCAHAPCRGGLVRSGNKNRCMKCGQCGKKTCHDCKLPWENEHKEMNCQQYERWVRKNRPELVIAEGVINFVICPHCNTQYEMVRGGCIHFTCRECDFDFCGFCRQAFHSPGKNPCKSCGAASTKGMHAHHPRHCPYYLRDYTVDMLWTLLQKHNQNMDILVPKNNSENKKCDIEYVNDELERLLCDQNPAEKCQGYCVKHFIELLTGAIYSTGEIDPICLMNKDQLRALADRENVDFDDLAHLPVDGIREEMKKQRPLVEDN